MTGLAVLCALGAAGSYGAGDFVGGLTARRISAVAVVAISHGLALLLLAPVAAAHGGSPSSGDLAWGAGAGLCGGVGVVLLYAALARGVMSVVAPTTAALAAVIPVGVGVAQGDRPTRAAALGVALALAAVVLLSRNGSPGAGAVSRAVVEAVGAGVAFGVVFVLLAQTGSGSGLWPLVSQRAVSTALFGAVAAGHLRGGGRRLSAGVLGAAAVCGILDTAANVLYLTAVRAGLLSLVAVLSSLYPAVTVLLARSLLGERLVRVQSAGMGLALVAVVLIAL